MQRSGSDGAQTSEHGSPWIAVLFLGFLGEVVLLGIAPWDRSTWALENLLVALGALLLVVSWLRSPLSSVSYGLILAFLAIHEVGAHYTYSQVPYDAWSRALVGTSLSELLGWERNHFDRCVHFLYGLLLAWPLRELVVRGGRAGRGWSTLLPILLTLSGSALYELIEWGAASVFGPELGIAYVGAQGDVWDAQRDMALALLGSALAMGTGVAGATWVHRTRTRRSSDV